MPQVIQDLQKLHSTKKIEVWFQDEARVGQHGTITRQWASTGSRPRALCDFRFESAYIFGAICPALKKASALVFSQVGSLEMNLLLTEISQNLSKDAHALIIMDRAPWHRSMTVPDNITVHYLPPYSPELNPVEQVWDFLRSNYLSNRVYRTLEDVFTACCTAWNLFTALPNTIFSIGRRSWIN